MQDRQFPRDVIPEGAQRLSAIQGVSENSLDSGSRSAGLRRRRLPGMTSGRVTELEMHT
jgi:hypothetical protein